MDTLQDGSTALVEILRKSIISLCQGNVHYAASLEVIGSIHIRSDQAKAVSFMLEEQVLKSHDSSSVHSSQSSAAPSPQQPAKWPQQTHGSLSRTSSSSADVLDLTVDDDMSPLSSSVGSPPPNASLLPQGGTNLTIKQEPSVGVDSKDNLMIKTEPGGILSPVPKWFRPTQDIKPVMGQDFKPAIGCGLSHGLPRGGHVGLPRGGHVGPTRGGHIGPPRGGHYRGGLRGGHGPSFGGNRSLSHSQSRGGMAKKPAVKKIQLPNTSKGPIMICRGDQLRYQCEYCDVVLSTRQSLTNHMNSFHFKTESYTCQSCGKQFNTNSALHIHRKRKHGFIAQKFNCSYCGQIFRSIPKLQQHTTKAHGSGGGAKSSGGPPKSMTMGGHHAPGISPRPSKVFPREGTPLVFPELLENDSKFGLSGSTSNPGADRSTISTVRVTNPFEDGSFSLQQGTGVRSKSGSASAEIDHITKNIPQDSEAEDDKEMAKRLVAQLLNSNSSGNLGGMSQLAHPPANSSQPFNTSNLKVEPSDCKFAANFPR